MKLYLVRHGETDWNAKGILMGQADIPLNATGVQQAEALRNKIAQRDLEFDAVYASPLQRTAKTAEIISPPNFAIIFDNRLKERNGGEFQGGPPRQLFDHEIDFLDMRLNSNAFGVEPIQDFHGRAANFLQDLQKSHPSDAKILVVTSNGLMKRMVSILTNTPPEHLPRFQNAEIYEYEL